MDRNALLDETRSRLLEPNLPFLRQLRASPTVAEVLGSEKADNESWGDFALLGMLALATMRRTVRADLRGANRVLVGIIGSGPTAVGTPDECRKPLAKAAAR